jgi:uncharacterized protein YwgA
MSYYSKIMENINIVGRFILLLAGSKQSAPIPGPIHLQKEMFLLERVFPELEQETDFEPYFLGPHSEIVQDETDELRRSGLLRIDKDGIQLSEEGKTIYRELATTASEVELSKIAEFKEFLNDLSKDELLAFVYFSDLTDENVESESIEYSDLLGKRKRLAMSLFAKGKVSAQKAAQIAGEDIQDFMSRA